MKCCNEVGRQPATTKTMLELYNDILDEDQIYKLTVTAERYVEALAFQRQCLPDIKYHRTLIRCFFFIVHWRLQGHDTTVVELAKFNELSWNSMERRLLYWEGKGLCNLVKRSGNTYVYGTECALEVCLGYARFFYDFFKVKV
tara:strand:- start:2266 stop:2694 length:429 start_codon:yes stop_codon:yes gene_type:complete